MSDAFVLTAGGRLVTGLVALSLDHDHLYGPVYASVVVSLREFEDAFVLFLLVRVRPGFFSSSCFSRVGAFFAQAGGMEARAASFSGRHPREAQGLLRLKGGMEGGVGISRWIALETVGSGHWVHMRGNSPYGPDYLDVYYRCIDSGECVWQLPAGAVLVGPEALAHGASVALLSDGAQYLAGGHGCAWSCVFAAPAPWHLWYAFDLEDGGAGEAGGGEEPDGWCNLYDKRRMRQQFPVGAVRDLSARPGAAVLGDHWSGDNSLAYLGGFVHTYPTSVAGDRQVEATGFC